MGATSRPPRGASISRCAPSKWASRASSVIEKLARFRRRDLPGGTSSCPLVATTLQILEIRSRSTVSTTRTRSAFHCSRRKLTESLTIATSAARRGSLESPIQMMSTSLPVVGSVRNAKSALVLSSVVTILAILR